MSLTDLTITENLGRNNPEKVTFSHVFAKKVLCEDPYLSDPYKVLARIETIISARRLTVWRVL